MNRPVQVANAPCSWGVLEFNLEGEPIGYTQVLDEITATGYAGTELGDYGFMPTDPAALRAELQARQLQLLGAFVPVELAQASAHEQGVRDALRTARLLRGASDGEPFIVLADANGIDEQRTRNAGRIGDAFGLDADQWQTFAHGAEEVARAVRDETGLRTVFHHHCGGYVETPAEVDQLLQLTDPELLGLCLDSGHYTYGGGDPLMALRQYGSRIWHVHFKDCEPDVARQARQQGWSYFEAVRNGVFCELGKGIVDFVAITAELEHQNYGGWIVVEQDVLPGLGTPAASATRNRAFLRRLGI
jgi:inosose dehydratase